MRVFALALLAAACATSPAPSGDTDPAAEIVSADVWAAPGPHGVGVRTVTLVDSTRGTPANGEVAALTTRTLPVEIWYPAATGTPEAPARDAAPIDGPLPVLVFAHGFMSGKTDHALLGASIASRGWVFAAPTFPLSNLTAPGGATVLDVLHQADDMGFLLDALLAGQADLSWLAGRVSTDHAVFGGMSLGGTTAMLAGLYPPTRDARVDAVIAVAPAACMVPLASFDATTPPLLLVHGDADAFVSLPGNSQPAYDASDAPKVLVTLHDATHAGFPDATAALFDAVPNADAIGCGAAGAALNNLDESLLVDLLPEGTPLLTAECAAPCEGELVTPTMKPVRQGLLLRASAHAFLAAVIDGDQTAATWLESGLAAAEGDVTVTSDGLTTP